MPWSLIHEACGGERRHPGGAPSGGRVRIAAAVSADTAATMTLDYASENSFYDPFDLWAVPWLGRLKSRWYEGSRLAWLALYLVYVWDWLLPMTTRRLLGVERHEFAHARALLRHVSDSTDDVAFIDAMAESQHLGGWGLPFAWYSKNGLYSAGLPLITATPYVMRELLALRMQGRGGPRAERLFDETWSLLESLRVHTNTPTHLALSYAPHDDPHTVVNANAYAAWAYGMHATQGRTERQSIAAERAVRLVRWVVDRQNSDGSWYYLAQPGTWNMIDGFHSCLVVRNLRFVGDLVPGAAAISAKAIDRGWQFIKTELFDDRAGLCRRYVVSHRPDPFRYDLYDQAEFLGLLIDFDEIEWARRFARRVIERFSKGGRLYCRIDLLGRRWGPAFGRWGIVPFEYQIARLNEKA